MRLHGLLVSALLMAASARGQQAPPDLRIESFVPVRAWAVGKAVVTLSGTVRNTGKTPLASGTTTARIYALAGLEYANGDTAPKLPELVPNGTAAFQWRLQPTSADGPLVAALALETPGAMPVVRVLAIPHFATAPPTDPPYVAKAPTARAGAAESVIENGRIRARILPDSRGLSVLLFSVRTASGWRQVGASVPLAQALSSEGGQRPWWELFKAEDATAVNGRAEATLELSGRIGLCWHATLSLTVRAASAAVDARLRLSPTRRMNVSGLRFCRFLAGEGSLGAAATEELHESRSGPNAVSAARWGDVTVGLVRQGSPPLAGWDVAALDPAEGADSRVLGAVWSAPQGPSTIEAGAAVELRARLFALTPSETVQDAFRVTLPVAAVTGARTSRR